MLAGKRAFQGNNPVSVLGNILHQHAPELRRLAPHIDERFEPIVQRCLRKEPGERFPSMAEVKTRLAELWKPGRPRPGFLIVRASSGIDGEWPPVLPRFWPPWRCG